MQRMTDWGQQQQFAPNPPTTTGPALIFDDFTGDILIVWIMIREFMIHFLKVEAVGMTENGHP